jgi:hypothetical protein
VAQTAPPVGTPGITDGGRYGAASSGTFDGTRNSRDGCSSIGAFGFASSSGDVDASHIALRSSRYITNCYSGHFCHHIASICTIDDACHSPIPAAFRRAVTDALHL